MPTMQRWARKRTRKVRLLVQPRQRGALAKAGAPFFLSGAEARTAIYVELLGNGGAYSIDFDRRVGRAAGFRIGVASWSADDWWSDEKTRMLTLPAQVYLLTAPAGAHHLELGGGLLVGHKHDPVHSGGFASLTATLGYRYQRTSGGFVFRAGFTPFFSLSGSPDRAYPDTGLMPSIGLSFGRAF